jgi:hypothetical protein
MMVQGEAKAAATPPSLFVTVTERNHHGRDHHHCRARTMMRKRSGFAA